ncbi:hypothetical protein J7547_08005 [Wohlfahrtiimonas chitiniclastica]|uniref:Core-binding (CB) domain-containing protein n=1 Tax=Wohlfahrtiimonas chitiniclastica TaxID=400946 RepID=A0AB35BY65_9GAMM|nr:hypothetical protein [Wohlfahrtiimonas chitiniclastica]MBS7824446.1 hypothetical protein [Wohlfahrtiimonas chitiniclastica]MBS7840763.1 hypothetical protein [Wohlfahrtiimonas chitiniclastica]
MIIASDTRHTVEVDLKNITNIKDVQSLIIKGTMADGRVFRVDIGRLCYTKRKKDIHNLFHSYSQYVALQVDSESLSLERVLWFSSYIEYISRKNVRNETIRGALYNIKNFFNYCDFEGNQPVTLDELINNYRSYQMVLQQKGKLGLYTVSSLSKLLNSAREFIQAAFNLSDSEILALIPKFHSRGNIIPERVVSLLDLEKYIQTCILVFNHFSDAILENRYPVRVRLLESNNESLYWTAPSTQELKNIPNCLDESGNLAPFTDIEEALSFYFDNDRSRKDFYRYSLVRNRRQWMNNPSYYGKIYAYNLCAHCFFRIYLAFTAANVQPSLDLKITDLDLSKIGSASFAKKYKHRAGKNVHFSASSYLKRLLLKYLKLREWLNEQEYSLDEKQDINSYLFVTISEHKKIIRLVQGAGWSPMNKSLFFKDLTYISLRDIRNLAAEYIIKQSKGRLSLVAKKLNNTIAMVAKSYTSIDLESQAVEMNDFHENLTLKIRQFNRETDDVIPINIIEDMKKTDGTERIATGSCSNLCELPPMRANGFNGNAPEPECGTFESCLFCKFFSMHTDFDDVHKLLSLREALLKTSSIRNDPEHFKITVEPSIYRISEIIKTVRDKNADTRDLVDKVEQAIDEGMYHKYWDKQLLAMEKIIIGANEEIM